TFNHEKAWIEISMTKNGITGYMPYKSIDSFDFYQNLGKHIIYMKKKDGAVWPLIQVSSQKKAEEVLELFREKILESKEVNTSYQFSLPEKFTTTLTNDKVLVYWKGKFSSAIIIVGLFIVLFSAVTTMAVFDLGKIWVMAIPFIMASAGLFFLVYKLYQQYSRKYAIAIDREHLMYYEFSGKTGKNKNMRSVPLTSIHTIVYISNLFSIKIITPDDIAYNELTANDPEKRMIDRIYNRNQPLLINLTAVNPAEGVSLEYWLQQQIGLMKPDLEIK
ncbi:MAG TPA: hypothetical protein PKC24_11165, partial [Cyclobacteriaceae bacterium]|nr:hypothetical protein [Cyclobacteriaceae bacterium]